MQDSKNQSSMLDSSYSERALHHVKTAPNDTVYINAVIHIAGIAQFNAIKHFCFSECERMFRVNVFSICEIIKALSSKLHRKHLRNIIFLSSISAHRGYKAMGLYGASKAGLCSLARSLSVELAPYTQVNSVVLAGIRTSGTEFLYTDSFIEKMDTIYPLGQGTIQDVANLIEFLHSKSRWISGQNIFLDGAMGMAGQQ
ncbi:SDR family NAD(P)-dependent oxidoreductase [Helicobacter aurati]|uniref:SDR family NAD(P)-dependent oxidoreductase n=1 Tax=Helicobacter aurati TaxID=137778 RepID=A0A3D8J6C4_9HELI|nr:SDR family oxidoreductase [Helicobacter aurati]RDU73057.1 SDR family NAD(P)-dependent oxidoreductase [Helicobacter aurati]